MGRRSIHCSPLWLRRSEKIHLKDNKQDVVNTNQKYREYLRRQEIEQEKKQQREEEERRAIDEALESCRIEPSLLSGRFSSSLEYF